MNERIDLLVTPDIGNGYVKGKAVKKEPGFVSIMDIPSCCAYVTSTHDLKAEDGEVPGIIQDIFNQMDVSFDSPVVTDGNRRLFGKRGIQSGMSLEEFDVFSHVTKAKQNLSGILVLGCCAGAALQDYFGRYGQLPAEDDIVDCHVRCVLALPIKEYKKYREEYAVRLCSGSHIVTFHNFVHRVRIQITFDDVQVVAEGASAQYAVIAKGPDFVEDALNDCRRYVSLDGITASDVLSATTTVGIDIGEGTTNFPVFQNGKFNVDVSVSMDKGYGSILTKVLDRLQGMGLAFDSRKELADYLQTPPSAIKRAAYEKIKQVVQEETVTFVNDVKMRFVQVMSRVGAYVEVVYVYGGGASPVRDLLYPELVSVGVAYSSEFPILYLDSRYSRMLNREGLSWIGTQVAREDGWYNDAAPMMPAQEPVGAGVPAYPEG